MEILYLISLIILGIIGGVAIVIFVLKKYRSTLDLLKLIGIFIVIGLASTFIIEKYVNYTETKIKNHYEIKYSYNPVTIDTLNLEIYNKTHITRTTTDIDILSGKYNK